MEYNFRETEQKWQRYWAKNNIFRAENNSKKPKYYVLDMFPYPSGAGLHVGHPLGYIASDIFSRYKRLQGFNVLHPMGFDSFGLPAEQYAIQTGQHPEITTRSNISRYKEQLDKIGLSFDWGREIRTSSPEYYKWTQWIFIQLFNSWYNPETQKAEPISTLIPKLDNFNSLNEKEQSDILLQYRLAYLSDTMVNWCPQLGTVLANEEVKDGVSERGGYPVERKLMKQWSLRITAYAERLLNDLDKIDWSESIKEAQRNWIGKSEGTSLFFSIENFDNKIEVFTTRPDTIFGVSYLTLAPEHELVEKLTSEEQYKSVNEYVTWAKNRSERERMAEVKKVTGVFTGSYAIHPFTGKQIPIWVGDYVLAGYGTGAVMAVPAHDSRDYAFAKHFHLPVIEVVKGGNISKESYDAKEGEIINSDFLNGLDVKDAIKKAIAVIEEKNFGKGKINYRMRDAIFGRQRYWGEPIPVYYKNGVPYVLNENELPLILPEVDKYLPTENGDPPLGRATGWCYSDNDQNKYEYELSTMPGWAGSSWYYLRYMDANNTNNFVGKDAVNYWNNVDLYIGGAEHATGHLLYVRFWTKFLFDLGLIPQVEPAKKLINQGMIQGVSSFVYRSGKSNTFISYNLIKDQFNKLTIEELEREAQKPQAKPEIVEAWKNSSFHTYGKVTALHVDINFVNNNVLNIEAFKKWREEFNNAEFVLENGKYICGSEVEKMSKSKWNVVSPDDIIAQYGADCLRLYEMFLGPLELSKPWNTNGITGVSNFMRKLWRLYHHDNCFTISDEKASRNELKVLHRTIKKISYDIEHFSFNTSVSNFMICVNELSDLKCNKREILEPLIIIISPYAPHIAEELWNKLGHPESITFAQFPEYNEEYLTETSFSYPISLNGKTKYNYEFELSLSKDEIEKQVMQLEQTIKLLDGKQPKKIIVVPNKIINIVI
ncbi:MAG: leucine--tRNA ligase [Bacteroidia bacterium]|nr:leucine--tRNA ligase [Bacteroidia bacterium]MCZ2247711.1 leucine--tRNA ligase [Bacteroidia bacterium]